MAHGKEASRFGTTKRSWALTRDSNKSLAAKNHRSRRRNSLVCAFLTTRAGGGAFVKHTMDIASFTISCVLYVAGVVYLLSSPMHGVLRSLALAFLFFGWSVAFLLLALSASQGVLYWLSFSLLLLYAVIVVGRV